MKKIQLRQPRSLRTSNKRGKSQKWSQMNLRKTNKHKDANEN